MFNKCKVKCASYMDLFCYSGNYCVWFSPVKSLSWAWNTAIAIKNVKKIYEPGKKYILDVVCNMCIFYT